MNDEEHEKKAKKRMKKKNGEGKIVAECFLGRSMGHFNKMKNLPTREGNWGKGFLPYCSHYDQSNAKVE